MIQPLVKKVLLDKMSLHCPSSIVSNVRFPSSTNFIDLKQNFEAYFNCLHHVLMVHMILKTNSDYVTKQLTYCSW